MTTCTWTPRPGATRCSVTIASKLPLAATTSAAQLALMHIDSGRIEGDALRELVDGVARQADKQSRLIQQVLDAARAAVAALPCERRPHDLAALAREVVEGARRTGSTPLIELRAPESVPAVADPLRLEQLLDNLVQNAIRFSPAGSRVHVEVGVGPAGEALLSVRDFGPGVPPEDRERIFERYYRGESGTGGLGLGLHLCREIARMHGGDLRVESPDGGGTRFVACLPHAAAAAAE